MTLSNVGYATPSATEPLAPWKYQIREPREDDVLIEVQYCGICHSDIHMVRSDWGPTPYPCVPGHEFTGIVTQTGAAVTKHKVGDRVGVGCMVHSCRQCDSCQGKLEQYCDHMVQTYGSVMPDGEKTYGGYGKYVVCQEHFAVKIPDNMPMDKAAPLLCAGITTYSPIKKMHDHYGRNDLKVGVIGLGGLGHMAVQFAASFGHEVYVISRNTKKEELGKKLGATGFIVSADDAQMQKHKQSLDYIIDTVSAPKPLTPYLNLLKVDGYHIVVGAPPACQGPQLDVMDIILKRRSIMGSCIGGITETQEMINYCSAKNILPYIECISFDDVVESYERIVNGDVLFRFVIDVKNSQAPL